VTTSVPKPPAGTGSSGRALWRQVLERFTLDQHELALLREAVRTVDQLDQLDDVVRAQGVMLEGRVHPAVVEARQLRLVLARLVASLRLPDEDEQRPQRRGSARGTYVERRVYGSLKAAR
jgi:hypothetical protein